jgi:hypothetical protein
MFIFTPSAPILGLDLQPFADNDDVSIFKSENWLRATLNNIQRTNQPAILSPKKKKSNVNLFVIKTIYLPLNHAPIWYHFIF